MLESGAELISAPLFFSMGTVGTVNTPESRMISSPFATFCTFWQHKVRVQCDVDSLGAEESTGTLADVRDIQVAELTFFPFALQVRPGCLGGFRAGLTQFF